LELACLPQAGDLVIGILLIPIIIDKGEYHEADQVIQILFLYDSYRMVFT
jgi:hypothetical protein